MCKSRWGLALLAALCFSGGAALAKDPSKDLKKEIAKAIQANQIDTAAKKLAELGEVNSEEAAEALTELLLLGEALPNLSDEHSLRYFYAVTEALGKITDKKARDFVYKLFADKKGDVRAKVALVDAIGAYGDETAITKLGEALSGGKQHEKVQIAIIRQLGDILAVKGVPALIAVMKAHESKRNDLWDEARRALKEITGEEFSKAIEWEDFWKARGDRFNPATDRAQPDNAGGTVLRDVPEIFGSEVASKRIIVIIDISGSMHQKEPLSEKEIKEGSVAPEDVTKQDNSPGPCKECGQTHKGVNLPEDRMRINRAKKELLRLIDALAGDVQFNLIRYSHEVAAWQSKGLVPANAANKNAAKQWVQGIKHTGTTLTKDALQKAFEIADDVNTIYLISDGVPTDAAGQPVKNEGMQEIHDMVANINKFRKVRINTIGFEGAHKAFMTELATKNDGEYTSVD